MQGRLNISQVVFWQRSQGKRTHADLHRMKECAGCAENDNISMVWGAEERSTDQDLTTSLVFSALQ